MSRDLRDPQRLGELFIALRKGGLPIEVAVKAPAEPGSHNPTTLEKYGRADEVEPKTEEIRIR